MTTAQKEKELIVNVPIKSAIVPGFVGCEDVKGLLGKNTEMFFITQFDPADGMHLVIRIVKHRKDNEGNPAKMCDRNDLDCAKDSWRTLLEREIKKQDANKVTKNDSPVAKE